MLFILAFIHCKAVAIKNPVGGTFLNLTLFFGIPTLRLPDFNQLLLHLAPNTIINTIC